MKKISRYVLIATYLVGLLAAFPVFRLNAQTNAPTLAPVTEARVDALKNLRFGMFICWSLSTYSGREWTPGVTNINLFAATNCDTDQWARTAKEAGMGYILFLTKHHDGLCFWDTKTTDRKITRAPLGRDVLAEVRKSCAKYGLKLALYFSEGEFDDNHLYHPGGYTPEMKKAQLKELLTQYGPIEYIWFDHAQTDGGLSHADTFAFCKSLQPDCFIGFNHGDQADADIRLGEMGHPGPLSDVSAAGPNMKDAGKNWRLAEFTYQILPPHQGGADWFYSLPKHDNLCQPAEKIYADYLGAVKYGNIFSLDVGPDYQGRLRDIDVKTLQQVGRYIRGEAKSFVNETPAQHDARMAWWREARFGMFIHWGVYSVPAGFYHGQSVNVGSYLGHPIPGAGEWIMNVGKIPMAEYQTYAKEFNPVKFDAEAWVKLAKAAGQKYIVITAKHHDGFAMFDTSVSPWGITHATPFRRDPLQELAAACKKEGIQLGFYYSQAQDWNNGGSSMTGKWDPAQQHDMDDYIDKVAVPQVKELLTHYGQFPSIIWWDTPVDMNPARALKLYDTVAQLKPGIIMNNRLGGGFDGDTETPEQSIPATGFQGRDWETCMTMNDTWGFRSDDQNFKSTATLIHNLCDIASKGGNYLLNVGPTSEGLIPAPEIERLQAVGAWMKVNGEAIYGTTASPFEQLPWGRCTKKIAADGKTTTLYLHVFDWPANGRLIVPGLSNTVNSARLLATGKQLKFSRVGENVEVEIPTNAPDEISSTVALNIKGLPEIVMLAIPQSADGAVRLLASAAKLQGELKYESGGGRDNVGYWLNSADMVRWTFQTDRPGKFKVSAELAALAAGKFEVIVGDQKLTGTAPVTGDYAIYKHTELTGTLTLAAGRTTLTVKPVAEGWHPLNLQRLELTPVE